ncbi:hypothetical protein [uncultured Methanoregula sp.]|uniref:hypothetical protein n=1 Tax=uncultured Methanoregula sp. TaxID=1005933 RepID=UPI002AAB35FA|nr:hypothetical protein [uncultured Methanoregula sp.]
MALAPILAPVSMLLELVICILGIYTGYVKKKVYGYLFAATFLLFTLYDYFYQIGIGEDTLEIVNLIAVLAALGGMYLVLKDR